MQLVIATHGHCFDGLASAVLFTHLHRALRGRAETLYRACSYGAGQPRPEALMTGDENALLDFRFSASEKVTWYFDHHRTAVGSDDERRALEEKAAGGQCFYEPESPSCARLIAKIARERFGVETPELTQLVDWADRIDTARFETAEQALLRDHPIQRFAAVVENHGGDRFLARMAPTLLERPLLEVASSRSIREQYRPLSLRRERFVKTVRASAERVGRVVLVDLTGREHVGGEKFVTYALFPDAVYSVMVGRSRRDVSISVGYNPWSGVPLDTDISAICARHGGGGHPVVGGISFEGARLEHARALARDIARELAR